MLFRSCERICEFAAKETFPVAKNISAFLGSERLTYRTVALWSLTITAYLVFFVAVKSTQYVLPALLPLMGAIFALPLVVEDAGIFSGRTRTAAWLASGAVFAAQLVLNLIRIRPRFF